MTQTMTRRRFVQLTAAATALFTAGGKAQLWYAPSLTYPAVKVANLSQVKTGEPIFFNYPDASSPAVLVKLGRPAIGGGAGAGHRGLLRPLHPHGLPRPVRGGPLHLPLPLLHV